MPFRVAAWSGLAALFVWGSWAIAFDDGQGLVIPGESRGTASRLAEADRRLADKHWTEALDELQAILDGSGDDLVPVGSQQSATANGSTCPPAGSSNAARPSAMRRCCEEWSTRLFAAGRPSAPWNCSATWRSRPVTLPVRLPGGTFSLRPRTSRPRDG
jgi:hypothetical protein